jgi:hypothetical protein
MKSGPADLARYRAEEIDSRTNAPWKKGRKMTHASAPELDADTLAAAEERLKAIGLKVMSLGTDKPAIAAEINAIREQTKDLPPLDAGKPQRKPRSDKGKPKPKKEQAPSATPTGKLAPEDTSRIKDLARSIWDARENLAAAQDRLDALEEEWEQIFERVTAVAK